MLSVPLFCKRRHHQVQIAKSIHQSDYTLYGYGQSNTFQMNVLWLRIYQSFCNDDLKMEVWLHCLKIKFHVLEFDLRLLWCKNFNWVLLMCSSGISLWKGCKHKGWNHIIKRHLQWLLMISIRWFWLHDDSIYKWLMIIFVTLIFFYQMWRRRWFTLRLGYVFQRGWIFRKFLLYPPFLETFQKINLLWNTQPPLKDDDEDNLWKKVMTVMVPSCMWIVVAWLALWLNRSWHHHHHHHDHRHRHRHHHHH